MDNINSGTNHSGQIDPEKTRIQDSRASQSSSNQSTQQFSDKAKQEDIRPAHTQSDAEKTQISDQRPTLSKAGTSQDQSDKTRIENIRPSGNTGSSSSAETLQGSDPASSQLPPKPDTNKTKSSSKGISTGAAIAGAAAAAAVGVTVGTVYAEEIKDGIERGKQVFAVTDEVTADGEDATIIDPEDVEPLDGNNDLLDAVNSISGKITDEDGNVYAVSLEDFDGDGAFEVQEFDIQGMDGSNFHFASNGDGVDPMLSGLMGIAGPADYVETGGFAIPASFVDQVPNIESYQIQPGDTLSEIAQSHQTSIANIMDLNPEITDPNKIQAGAQLILPTDDDINDPYQGLDNQWLHTGTNEFPANIVSAEGVDSTGMAWQDVPVESASYEQVDWGSFEEEAASDSDYESLFTETNFDNMGGDYYDAADFF